MTSRRPSRCAWAKTPLSIAYHDVEWGVPVHDDRRLFEFLTLEGAQAGLSWETILKKRENYHLAFRGVRPGSGRDVHGEADGTAVEESRHRQESAEGPEYGEQREAVLAVSQECGSFDAYVWSFVDGAPVVNRRSHRQLSAVSSGYPLERLPSHPFSHQRIDDDVSIHFSGNEIEAGQREQGGLHGGGPSEPVSGAGVCG